MYPDFRTFLAEYEKNYPQDVVHVTKDISARWEIAALIVKADKVWQEPPFFIFHNVINHLGQKSKYSQVVNLTASRVRASRILETEIPYISKKLYERALQSTTEPVIVKKDEAPVKQHIKMGEDIDLYEFAPLIKHEGEPGPYISFGFATCYDPESYVDNSVLQRGWVAAKDEVRWWPNMQSDNYSIMTKWESLNKDMPVTFWIGHHPLAMFGCNMGLPSGASHFKAAGGVLGQPLRLVSSETLGEHILVPADAEIVIEGICPHHQRRPEGPYGESYGHTGGQRWNPYIKVTAITHRKNAYWLSTMTGHKDSLSSIFAEKRTMIAYDIAKRAVPSVRDIRTPGHPGLVYVQIAQERPGEAIEAGLSVAASEYGYKVIIVVDDDIDIYDDNDIWIALGSRVQWDRDIIIIPRGRGAGTDPSLIEDGISSKIVIDATKPLPFQRPFASRSRVPKEVMDKIKLEDFLPTFSGMSVK